METMWQQEQSHGNSNLASGDSNLASGDNNSASDDRFYSKQPHNSNKSATSSPPLAISESVQAQELPSPSVTSDTHVASR